MGIFHEGKFHSLNNAFFTKIVKVAISTVQVYNFVMVRCSLSLIPCSHVAKYLVHVNTEYMHFTNDWTTCTL